MNLNLAAVDLKEDSEAQRMGVPTSTVSGRAHLGDLRMMREARRTEREM